MPRSRFLRWLLYLGLFVLLTSAAAYALGVRFNLTPSLPPGLYVETDGAVVAGQTVTFCPPAHVAPLALERGYVPAGSCPGGAGLLGKTVLAVAGDTVALSAEGLRVNGAPVPNSAVLTHDGAGRLLPSPTPGARVVGPDSFFAFSGRHPRSFDSRYFGPVPVGAVRSAVRPLWTAD